VRLTLLNPPGTQQAGALVSQSATINGLTDTSAMLPGAIVTGIGIPFGTLVATVVSPTSVTITNPATVSGTQTISVGIEPLDLATVRNYLKLDSFTDDDFIIAAFIAAARGYCEKELRQALITQSWVLNLDSFPSAGGYYNRAIREIWPSFGSMPSGIGFYPGMVPNSTGLIEIPMPPLQSITSVQYTDFDGSLRTVSPTVYSVSLGKPARIQPTYSNVWPLSRPGIDAVKITFQAGYGDTPSAMPPNVQAALMLLVSTWYVNRTPVVAGSYMEIPLAVESLLSASDHGSYA
jgi:hypothetical protein